MCYLFDHGDKGPQVTNTGMSSSLSICLSTLVSISEKLSSHKNQFKFYLQPFLFIVYQSLPSKSISQLIFIPPVITACSGSETSTGVFQQLQGPRSLQTGWESECKRCTPTDSFKILLHFRTEGKSNSITYFGFLQANGRQFLDAISSQEIHLGVIESVSHSLTDN